MENKYDVIIIGAGPAGLECANTLNNTNLSVLLIEKNKVIGPKICAGGLTNLDAQFDIPEDKTRCFSKQEIIIIDQSYRKNLVNPLKTISRLELGQFQLNKINKSSNIKILKDTLVKRIEKNRVITNKGTFYFKYLVGADGSNSIVRKYLGLKSKICIGMFFNIKKITNKFIWYANPRLLKSGYIWIFPHKRYTNIGVYFNPECIDVKNAKSILEDFLNKNNYRFNRYNFKAAPINYFYQGCIFKNIFLIGDAAGLASKATGEGISFALTSGKEIAKKILDSNYKLTELNRILIIKKRQERMLKIRETMLKIFEKLPFMQVFLFRLFVNLMKKKWFQKILQTFRNWNYRFL